MYKKARESNTDRSASAKEGGNADGKNPFFPSRSFACSVLLLLGRVFIIIYDEMHLMRQYSLFLQKHKLVIVFVSYVQ